MRCLEYHRPVLQKDRLLLLILIVFGHITILDMYCSVSCSLPVNYRNNSYVSSTLRNIGVVPIMRFCFTCRCYRVIAVPICFTYFPKFLFDSPIPPRIIGPTSFFIHHTRLKSQANLSWLSTFISLSHTLDSAGYALFMFQHSLIFCSITFTSGFLFSFLWSN